MKVTIEYEVTRKTVIEGLLERRRLACPGESVPRPKDRAEALHWITCAVRAHGLNLWASVDEAHAKAVTEACALADELFPELT